MDISLSREDCEDNSHAHVSEGSGDVFHTADISDAVEISQMGGSGHVLTVKVIDNTRIPAFSELEILAQVKSNGSHCYMLESNLKNSDLLVVFCPIWVCWPIRVSDVPYAYGVSHTSMGHNIAPYAYGRPI